jgi:16S rRNA pseudouridine516 synthase
MRLDRLVGKWAGMGKRRTRELFESGEVRVNGRVVERDQRGMAVGTFDRVEVGAEIVQARVPRSLMLHKPAGVVSATVDETHKTVIDLIETCWAPELHLAGRLDRFTTGLMILTNDGDFSRKLTDPGARVGKEYVVGTDRVIGDDVITAFESGLFFEKEGVTTAPAQVVRLGPRSCRLTIYEGKHHQVKRMFARFALKVVSLHRMAIGTIRLPEDLREGEWRELSRAERELIRR